MLELKNVRLTAAILGASILPTAIAQAGTIGLYQGNYSYDVGGEFTAITSPASFVNNYSPLAQYTVNVGGVNVTGFQTFCVQVDEEFYPGTIYNYSVSLASVGNPGNVDVFPLSEGAAWLYSEFARGLLSGYDYHDNGSGNGLSRRTDAGLLQAALWALQGGQTYGDGDYASVASTEANNPFYLLALNTLGTANLELPATSSTDFGVEILNISDSSGHSAQNQLVYVGVPDGGATLGMLTAGLAGLATLSRWRKRPIPARVAVRARHSSQSCACVKAPGRAVPARGFGGSRKS